MEAQLHAPSVKIEGVVSFWLHHHLAELLLYKLFPFNLTNTFVKTDGFQT